MLNHFFCYTIDMNNKPMTNLKRMRKAMGLKQKDVARVLGITQQAWTNIENGKTNLSERNKTALIEKLNVNPEFLENGTEPIFKNIPPRDVLVSSILDGIDRLNPSNKKVILDLIESLSKNNNTLENL